MCRFNHSYRLDKRSIKELPFLDKVAEKYRSKVMEELRDHLRVSSGMNSGQVRDIDVRAFPSSKKIILD